MNMLRHFVVAACLVTSGCALFERPRPLPPPPAPHTDWLSTRGNQIVDESGAVWMGRGVNLHDTRSCKACAFERPGRLLVLEVKRRIDFLVDKWGVNLIRLNLESYPPDDPDAERMTHYGGVLDDPGYFAEVIEIVRHIGDKPGVYVLLSLWEEPSFDPTLGIPTNRTRAIWERLAGALAHQPHVIYGLSNEPRGHDGSRDPEVWHAMNDTAAAIRAVEERIGAPHHLIAVQGTRDYGRDLSFYMDNPIAAGGGTNVIYEAHIYNPSGDFNRLIALPWSKLPLIIGEFGPIEGVMTNEDTRALMKLADTLRIPYTAWTFHQRCPPNLIEDTDPDSCGIGLEIKPTAWGRQLRDHLRAKRVSP